MQGALLFLAGLTALCYGTHLAVPPAHPGIYHWQQKAPVGALSLMAVGFLGSVVGCGRARSALEDQIDRTFMPIVLIAVTVACALIVWG